MRTIVVVVAPVLSGVVALHIGTSFAHALCIVTSLLALYFAKGWPARVPAILVIYAYSAVGLDLLVPDWIIGEWHLKLLAPLIMLVFIIPAFGPGSSDA